MVLEDVDAATIEREVCRLPDVSVARIVADDIGRITEIHVVARPGKPAKQIARDVTSVILAEWGIEVDRRVVSVVQLEAVDPGSIEPPPLRPTVRSIDSRSEGLRTRVRVTLAVDGAEAVGEAEGSIASSARHRLVAGATVEALRALSPPAECIDVESAQVVRVGERDVAVVTVVFVAPPDEHVVSGSALVVDAREAEAITRAVLDATNRRLARIRPPA